MPILTCSECNSQFEPRKAWQKYCSQDCNQSAYLKRKLDKKRKNPLQVLDLDLGLGPSPAQEAEWQRRTDLADAAANDSEAQRKAKAEAVVKKMEELETQVTLEDWAKKL